MAASADCCPYSPFASFVCSPALHADPRHRHRAGCLRRGHSRHRRRQADCAGIAGDEARPCRSADAADRARHQGIRHAFRSSRPHRGDHRSRQLYRLARRSFRRARHCAGRRQAGGRGDHADRLCRARRQPERRAAGHFRHRCAARPCVFSGGQRQWRFVDPAAGRADRGSAWRVKIRRAASGRQRRQDSRRPLAGGCAAAVQGRSAAGPGYRLGGVARGRGQPE